jgi:hypothetical protein
MDRIHLPPDRVYPNSERYGASTQGGIRLRNLSYPTQSHPCVRSSLQLDFLLLATAMLFISSALHAQSVTPPAPSDPTQKSLPDLPQTGADSGLQPSATPSVPAASGSGSSFHPRSMGLTPSASTPFKIPRSISETTSSGIKFQLGLPRVLLGTGQRAGGQFSPLDSSGLQAMGGGASMFPSASGFGHSTDAASDGMFGTPPGGFSRTGTGGGNSAGGLSLSVPAKSSIFDVHLSMKDTMGGSFSGNAGGSSAGASAGAQFFGASSDGAGDFGNPGGLHSGAGGKGSGAKLSMGLRF